jgi:tetratricopeptide (TPR) repeat protein
MKRIVVAIAAAALASAAPPPPDDLVRRGNSALRAGDPAVAARLYAAAEEHSPDPGLVAFNRAAALFEQGEYREAEVHYLRALDDKAAPPDRRAKALYNRGVCLVKRASDLPALRAAVSCFEQALDSDVLDEPMRADARYNLELAKLLWAEARAKLGAKDTPNQLPPEEQPESKPPATGADNGSEPGRDTEGPGTRPGLQPQAPTNAQAGGQAPQATDRTAPGHGTLPVLVDGPQSQKLSPEDARAHLAKVAERLDRDRRANARLLAGPERPHVPDY